MHTSLFIIFNNVYVHILYLASSISYLASLVSIKDIHKYIHHEKRNCISIVVIGCGVQELQIFMFLISATIIDIHTYICMNNQMQTGFFFSSFYPVLAAECFCPILIIFSRQIERLYLNQLRKFQLNVLKIEKLMIISVLQMPIKC